MECTLKVNGMLEVVMIDGVWVEDEVEVAEYKGFFYCTHDLWSILYDEN